ncbi:alpha/beta fold hydrolase [Silvanigrella paludirubra]|nr:alpha/beta hydrolase [Silvanigrella paludirubra]
MDKSIRNSLQSMLKSEIINSYQIYFNNFLISKSNYNINCKTGYLIYSSLYNNFINENIYILNSNREIEICYEKYYYNNDNKFIGSIQISVPVKLSDYKDFFVIIIMFFIIIFIIYIYLLIYIKKYIRIVEKSRILSHDITLPLLMVENNLKNLLVRKDRIKKNIFNCINTVKTSRSIIEYFIDKYIYNKEQNHNKSYKLLEKIIHDSFLSLKNFKKINISYEIINTNKLFIKIIKEDLYIIFINLIKNAIESSLNNNLNYIHFLIDYKIQNNNLIINFFNSNTYMSDKNINKFTNQKFNKNINSKANGAFIIFNALKRNNGKIEINNNQITKYLEIKLIFYKIEFIEKRISKIDSKKLNFIIIDDDYKSQDIWNHLLKKCQIKFYFEPDTFFEDIILGKININKYDVIISDFIFKSDNTSNILTADKIKISYKLKEKYKYNGLLLLSSSLSENEFNNNKDLSYFDKNIENKFLSYKKIRTLYLKKKEKMSKIIEIDGNIIEYYIIGNSKHQIYLFNGFGSFINNWSKKFLIKLSKNFQIILFNYPNFGLSKSQEKVISFDDYSRFFYLLFKKTYKEINYALLGYSMGGYVLRNTLLLYPKLAPKKIIFCSTSYGGIYRIQPNKKIIDLIIKQDINLKKVIYNKNYYTNFKINKLSYRKNNIKNCNENLNLQTNLIYKFFNEKCDGIKIHIDSLIIHGKNDLIFHKNNAELLRLFCNKNSEIYYINSGHGLLFTDNSIVVNKINKFYYN